MQRLSPPPSLNSTGNLKENWRKFKQQFDIYVIAAGLSNRRNEIKANTLLHVIGPEAVEIYNTFTWDNPGDETQLDKIKQKFEEYCNPRRNITYERHVFNTRVQEESESIDSYVTDLKLKAKSCEFGPLENSLIRDRIVCGIKNDTVRRRLLSESDVTLEKAMEICRATEISEKQLKTMNDTHGETQVNVLRKKRGKQSNSGTVQKQSNSGTMQKEEYDCQKCGRRHGPRNCPAYGKICKKCGRNNHFAVKCRSKTRQSGKQDVHYLGDSDSDSESDDFNIDTVETKNDQTDWKIPVQIGKQRISLKLDTGAQCNVLPKHLYDRITKKPLTKSKARLVAYSGHKIKVVVKTTLTVTYKDKFYLVEFQIVNGNAIPVLGLNTCIEMNLVKRVHVVNIDNKDPNSIMEEYADVFKGLGCLEGEHHIKIDKSVKSVVHPPRKVPFALKKKVKTELDRMESQGVIGKVSEPSEWVNSMVVVEKGNKVRICIDPRDLNKAVQREHYPMKTVEEVASKLNGAKYFSTLDVSSGFWTIKVDKKSSELLTSNTPFGRYRYKRLAFGVTSAPEVFQKRASQIFEDIENCEVFVDDILLWGSTIEQHNQMLRKVLERARQVNLRLNKKKCKIGCTEVTYIGHKFGENEIKVDSEKVQAIQDIQRPTNKKELQRFTGMINYVSKFIPNLSIINKRLRQLLEKNIEFHWDERHEQCFNELKKLLSQAPVLRYYDQNKELVLSVDSSSEGLGACILQEAQPVAYASRSLNKAERNYAQIEKELLAIVYGCNKFHQYIYGRQVVVESDHKPLEALFKKSLASAPLRIQKMMLKLQKYDLKVMYKPGKYLYIADTLSRSATNIEQSHDDYDEFEVHPLSLLSITETRLEEIRKETEKDHGLQTLKQTVLNGWPESRSDCDSAVKEYWNYREEITVNEGILLKNQRAIVPKSMRKFMLDKLHSSHMGIEKCTRRARDLVFWPGIHNDITDVVSKCQICNKYRNSQQKEPLKVHDLPDRPWQKVGMDLLELDKVNYLVIVDYYSKFFEVAKLASTKSKSVINKIKPQFARYGIPEEVISDNGPQFSSQEFKEFARQYEFQHITSSPKYSQSNGMVERTVQTAKRLMKKAKDDKKDPCLALLDYRNTPIEGIGTPTQLLMGRRTRTLLPTNPELLKPSNKSVKKALQDKQVKQKYYYDRNAKELPELKPGDSVRITTENNKPAVVKNKTDNPRSYNVQTEDGAVYRRNRKHLLQTNEKMNNSNGITNQPNNVTVTSSEGTINRTSSGRIIKLPKRFGDFKMD